MGSDPAQIDRELLTTHNACREGVAWFDKTWPGGVASCEQGLEALERGEHLDFIAWVLLQVPNLRERVPAGLRRDVLGPRHAELIALADDTARSAWLTPRNDAGEDDLDTLAILVGEHHDRLAALPNGAAPGFRDWSLLPLDESWSEVAPVIGLSWDERHGPGPPTTTWALAWRNAWRAAGGDVEVAPGGGDLTAEPWFELRLWHLADVSARLRPKARVARQVCRALDNGSFVRCYRRAGQRFRAAREGSTWQAAARAVAGIEGAQGPAKDPVVHATETLAATARIDLGAAALWLLADVPEPSPWEPLLAMWRLGYWPAGAIDGTFIVGKPAASRRASRQGLVPG